MRISLWFRCCCCCCCWRSLVPFCVGMCACVCVCLSIFSLIRYTLFFTPLTTHFAFCQLDLRANIFCFCGFLFFAFLVNFHLILSFLFFPYFLLSLTTNFLCIPLVLKCSYIPKYYSKCFQNDDFPFDFQCCKRKRKLNEIKPLYYVRLNMIISLLC